MMPSNRLLNLPLSNSDRAEPAKIWKARSYIQDHLEEELSLRIVAKFAQISPPLVARTSPKIRRWLDQNEPTTRNPIAVAMNGPGFDR